MAERSMGEGNISWENVKDWTKDLSDLILVQRTRVASLKSQMKEAELKRESLESLLREAIIAHTAEVMKASKSTAVNSMASQQLESLKSRLREAIIEQGARVRKLEGKSEKDVAVERLESLKADYKAATGKEWSEVRAEGPILLTTNKVRGREILQEFSERLRELRRKNIIRSTV